MLSRTSPSAPLDLPGQQKVDAILRYITENLAAEVRLDDAARAVGMTPSGLSRFVTRAAGRGFADTVRHLRVLNACTLLFETDHPSPTSASTPGSGTRPTSTVSSGT